MNSTANFLYGLKNNVLSYKANERIHDIKYKVKSKLGLLKAYLQAIRGYILVNSKQRPLIVGRHLKLHMEADAAITLIDSLDEVQLENPMNPFYPNATSICMPPYWRFLDHPYRKNAHLRLQRGAKLVCSPNSLITPGVYISIWPNQELYLGTNSYIGHNTFINTKCGLIIGNNSMIGFNCNIMDYDGHPIYSPQQKGDDNHYGGASKKITIHDNVWVGFNVTILKGVTIHKSSIVASNSVVTNDVPPNSIVAGNPAKIIREEIRWEKW